MKGQRKRGRQKRGGKTISKSEQEWTLPAQLGQPKTGQDGEGLLLFMSGVPTTFQGYGIE